MAIKAIVFDCFGVLVSPGSTMLYRAYPQLHDEINDLAHQSDYGMISRAQFNSSIAKLISIKPDEVQSRYYDINVRDESTFSWVRELKSSGKFKLGLLSNVGHNWLNDFIPAADRAELFDEVVISGDVGMIKPEIKIFELMAERLGLQTNECVMIDDVQLNIEGAVNAGMQGIVFKTANQARSDLKRLLGKQSA